MIFQDPLTSLNPLQTIEPQLVETIDLHLELGEEKAKQSWEECLKIIKKNISFQAYQTWFESLSVVNSDDEQITLRVPNRFHYEWVDSKYGDLMRSAIKKHFGYWFKSYNT